MEQESLRAQTKVITRNTCQHLNQPTHQPTTLFELPCLDIDFCNDSIDLIVLLHVVVSNHCTDFFITSSSTPIIACLIVIVLPVFTISCYHHSHFAFIISDFHHLSHVGERDGGASRGPSGCSQRQSQDQVRRSLCTARSTDDGETASGEVAGAAGGVGETGRGFWSQVRPSQPSYHILAIGRNIIHQHTYQSVLSTLPIDQPFHHTL